MKVGYARVSTFEQDLDLQMDALEKEGCDRTLAGLAAARARGRKGARKKSITEGQMIETKRLADEGKLSISDICKLVGSATPATIVSLL